MNEVLKDFLDNLVRESDQPFVWGRTNDEFLNKSSVEYTSFSTYNQEEYLRSGADEPPSDFSKTKVLFKIITQKWKNTPIPWITNESILLSPSEWRDIKLKLIIDES
jgi:hypothetical protein